MKGGILQFEARGGAVILKLVRYIDSRSSYRDLTSGWRQRDFWAKHPPPRLSQCLYPARCNDELKTGW